MTKSRDLPPLLPLEYCRIDRAARMLECEVEDIIHWGATAAILVCANLGGEPGTLDLTFDDDNGNLVCKHESMPLELTGASEAEGDRFTDPYYINQEFSGLIKEILGFTENQGFFEADPISFLEKNVNQAELKGDATGLWPLSHFDLRKIEDGDTLNGGLGWFYFRFPFRGPKAGMANFFLANPKDSAWRTQDLFILGDDLGKLYRSLTTGVNLPSIYGNPEQAQRAREQDEVVRNTMATRITTKQSDLICALIDLHFTQEGKRLDDMGHQAFFNEVLSPALAKAGIPCPTTDRSFYDWMKKARKFSK